MVTCVLVHVGRKRTGRNGADGDAVLRQAQGHPFGQVDQATFAGGVGIGFLRVDRHAVDGRDVDHLGQVVGGGSGEHRGQRLGQEERGFEVQIHHLVPATFWKLVKRRAQGGTCVVDQDVQGFFMLAVGGHQRRDASGGRHIGGQRNTGAKLGQLGRCLVTRSGLAGGDVDPCALGQETFGDHAANAA